MGHHGGVIQSERKVPLFLASRFLSAASSTLVIFVYVEFGKQGKPVALGKREHMRLDFRVSPFQSVGRVLSTKFSWIIDNSDGDQYDYKTFKLVARISKLFAALFIILELPT